MTLHRVLLGPQRPIINLGDAFAGASFPDGQVAVISAGWQEAEGDIEEIADLIQRPVVGLNLYQMAEALFVADQRLHTAYRNRQDQLQELQRLYRLRLRHLMTAARELKRTKAVSEILLAEQRHAISQLRALDRHHLGRIESVYNKFADYLQPQASVSLAEHMHEIAAKLESCACVLITGGNVLVLLNRLQLFGMGELLRERHIIAWSAGAMVLSDLIVLYHDNIPLGRRDAEVLGKGLGILPGHIFLPDSSKRLRKKDKVRTTLFHQRFSPSGCLTLDSGNLIHFEGNKLRAVSGVGQLTSTGAIRALKIDE